MNKVVKFIVSSVFLELFAFCGVASALREVPNEKSMHDIPGRIPQTTLNDEWMSFDSACSSGKSSEIINKGNIFVEDVMTSLDNIILDESLYHKIIFLCNSKIIDLLDMFGEEEIEKSDLKELCIKLCKVLN